MFLESTISTSNLNKSWKMYLCWYWRNHIPVLAKSSNCVGQIVFWYWPNRLPVLTNLKMHTYKLCISLLPTFWICILVLTKSSTSICKIIYQYCLTPTTLHRGTWQSLLPVETHPGPEEVIPDTECSQSKIISSPRTGLWLISHAAIP